MELLGGSQTFIGVLATIVMVCVIADESGNFIYRISKEIIEGTEKEVECIKIHLSNIAIDLINSDEYRHFLEKVKPFEEESSNKSSSISSWILNQKMKFDIGIDNYMNKYSPAYFLPINTRIEEIKCSREQTFSPLYVFAFCVLLFICDEICRWNPDSMDLIVGMLSFFMIISFIFLLFIWIKFMKECGGVEDISSKSRKEVPRRLIRDRIIDYTKQFLICLAILWILYMVICILSEYFHFMPLLSLGWLFIFLGAFLFVWRGYKHHKKSQHYGKYSHSLLLEHFIVLVLISLVFSGLFYLPILHETRLPYENLYLFRIISVFFIIINGIIFPFLFPYLANNNVLTFAKKKDKEGETAALEEGKGLKKELNNVIQKVNNMQERELESILEFRLLGTDCCTEVMRGII